MDLVNIEKEVKKLKPKAHKRFVINFLTLVEQIQSSIVLRGPYRLVLDSNIIMRLESYKEGNVSEGLLSVFLAFIYLKKLPFNFDVVVRPVVFFEFLRLKNVSSTREHWNEFRRLISIVEDELYVKLFFDGIETYTGAEYYGKLIERDTKKIVSVLSGYKKRNWRFNFIQKSKKFDGYLLNNGFIEISPYFAAHGLYKEVGLKYFDEFRSSMFFIAHIEKHIRECNKNDQNIIGKYPVQNSLCMTEILKLSPKGKLVGLADIDILTLCNVQSQFTDQAHGRYIPASIGLSLDNKLSEALRFFSILHLSSGQISGGVKNLEDNMAKMEAFEHDRKRIVDGEVREKLSLDIALKFIDEIDSVGTFEPTSA